MRYKQEAEEQGHSWFWPVIIVIALILIYYLYEKHAGGLHSQTPENATETTLRVEALNPQPEGSFCRFTRSPRAENVVARCSQWQKPASGCGLQKEEGGSFGNRPRSMVMRVRRCASA